MQDTRELQWKAVKQILHYVRGTHTNGIHYLGGTKIDLVGYIDSDWFSDLDHLKSTSGYSFSLGSGHVSWSSKKQNEISISSTEAEYRGVVNVVMEVVWLHVILTEF
ncbi:hypothetical protein KI387_031429, partial [Taxus chinensis]